MTTIKRDLSPDLNPFDYAIWGILENKTNATSHPNIGSLKTATEEEKMAVILSKFTVLCLSSYFVGYFFLIKINRVYYYTRIFHTLYLVSYNCLQIICIR